MSHLLNKSPVVGAAFALCCAMTACGSQAGGGTPDAPKTAPATTPSPLAQAPVAKTPVARSQRAVARTARRSCRGRTPAGVRAEYLPKARRSGADAGLLRLAADPSKRLRNAASSAGLAAAVYASTRPVAERPKAFSACRIELRRVTAKKGSS